MTLQAQQAEAMALCLAQDPSTHGRGELDRERDKWAIYRHMVRHRLLEMVRRALPRTISTVGEENLAVCFSRYLQDTGPISRYIRDTVTEFASYAEACWRSSDQVPAIATSLIRYESECWSRAYVPAVFPSQVAEFSFELPILLNPTLSVLQLDYPAHQATVSISSPAEPTSIGIFRHPDTHRVHTWNLTPLSRELLLAWQAHATLPAEQVVRGTLKALQRDPTPGLIDGLCDMLTGFLEHKLVLGSLKTQMFTTA
jgi:hypothetical protein